LNHTRIWILTLFLIVVSAFNVPITVASMVRIQQSEPVLVINPSSLVIKVGESGNVSLTVTNAPSGFGYVCFGVEDFPTTGFVTTFVPSCVDVQSSSQLAVLTIEATPAAAPQSFTAYVTATHGDWTGKVAISITVQPAMPAWIPWSIILVFVLILIVPLIISKKRRRA